MSLADFISDTAPVEPRERPEVEEIVTPSGLAIRYDDRKHRYWINDQPVDSVSKILGCLDKPALPYWGMKIGVEGVLRLAEMGHLSLEAKRSSLHLLDPIVASLVEHKLTTNHVRDKAGARGTTVHDALETWATTGALPDPERYHDEQQGYVRGLLAFLADVKLEPIAVETIVGSAQHGFAGRYDLRCRISPCNLVTGLKYDKKTGQTTETRSLASGGIYLVDLKTTGAVYLEALLQMEAYEGAAVESGHSATDKRAVLRVTADGRYELRLSTATYKDFLAVKACHDAVVSLRERSAA